VERLQALSSLSQQTLQSFADEVATEDSTATFDAERSRSLEGLCKKENGVVTRSAGESCCQVCARASRVDSSAVKCTLHGRVSLLTGACCKHQFFPYTAAANGLEKAGPKACFKSELA